MFKLLVSFSFSYPFLSFFFFGLLIAYNLWIQDGLLYGVCGNKLEPNKKIRAGHSL